MRGLVLYSGSSASVLAARLMQLGSSLDLHLLHLQSPFFQGSEFVKDTVRRLFPTLPFKCHTLKRDFLRMTPTLLGLPFPCGPCRRVLLSKAARAARRLRADVVISADVVGRGGLGPEELCRLDRSVGLEGRVVRPLSARLLPPSLAEERGWIDPSMLLSIDGDTPHGVDNALRQLNLDALPGSGKRCALQDQAFAQRVEDLLQEGPLTVNNLQLLEFEHYRHFPPDLQVVVACDRPEQGQLQTLFLPHDVRMYLLTPRSPLTLLRADWNGRCTESVAEALGVAAELTLEVAGLSPRSQTVCFRLECEDETHRLSLVRRVGRGHEEESGLRSVAVGVSLPPLMPASF